ncbi:phosphohistidine phosphatase SixA [Desulfovibrio ferrophilus]|uniref:Putative phosphohistidine phosphatase, SixA n=1 Tax=Desulfovibrio ferrophilus TaxID=241368 RepID=A0A2Z6AW64_9BACT|nr:phosphohistidine phosphatase SixA [Desulfovibrio ferrophilus]BBD07460.1 putative phosphohistidine phosphatase, SixA [Desulfovibrio ferrophilus]
MELYLMQHGSCLSKEIDPDQPLSPVGRDQIFKSADAIRRLGLGFDAIVCSPKLRAVQTAEAVTQALGLNASSLTITESVKAMKRPEETVTFLRNLRAESIIIAGHLPNLGELASYLLSSPNKLRLGIENGGLMRIDADTLPTNNAVLRWMLSPMQLQLIAGR